VSDSSEVEIEFEAALGELEQIVEALERGGPDLKEALAGYGRGVSLLGHCQGILDGAERSVALLTGVDDAGQPITSPFDSAATTSPSPSLRKVEALTLETVSISVPPTPTPSTRKPKPTPAADSTIPEAPF